MRNLNDHQIDMSDSSGDSIRKEFRSLTTGRKRLVPLALTVSFVLAAVALRAQTAAKPSGGDSESTTDRDVVTLNPFVVTTQQEDSYTATDTLAGNRARTNLADVGSSVQVVTQKFLQDTNSNDAASLLVYTTSTEVSGPKGNFLGQGNGPYLTAQTSNTPITRVRGLDGADLTTDFFLTRIPFDSYNTGRVDIQRGPNAILFGIGSSGGIINATSNDALFANRGNVTLAADNYGTLRGTFDFNRTIVPNELAIRIAGVSDDTQYRQDPAYKDDHRIYATLKWDPSFLSRGSAHTSFTAKFENGQITGTPPVNTPPIDSITPYFTQSVFQGPNGTRALYTAAGVQAAAATNGWLTTTPNGRNVFNITAFEAGGGQGVSYYGLPFAWPNLTGPNAPNGVNQGYRQFGIAAIGPTTGKVGSQLGAFKAYSLTDPSIFDFYNHLLGGPNSSDENNFNSFTASLSQTFFDNKVGFNLAYNRQKSVDTNEALLSGGTYAIGVDVMSQLPNESVNPNAGRPAITGTSGTGSWSSEIRDTVRFSAYAELDLSKHFNHDSVIGKILGRHVFTGLVDRYSISSDNRGYLTTMIASDPANWQSNNPQNVETAFREDAYIYLGNPVNKLTTANGLHLAPVTGVLTYKPTSQVLWNNVTNTFVNAPLNVLDNSATSLESRAYLSGSLAKSVINSRVINWQAYLWDGLIVPSIGYRTDADNAYGAQAGSLAGTGLADLQSKMYALPGEATATAKGHANTYSLVVHLPESLTRKLPFEIKISPFVNQSENFRPSAGRIDMFGNPLASPTGKTKEYGVTLTALHDKVRFKVTHFETSVSNTTIPGLGSPALNAIIAYGWGQSQYHAWTNPIGSVPYSFLQGVYGTSSSGGTLFKQPDGYGAYDPGPYPQALVDSTYSLQTAAIAAWSKPYSEGGAQLPKSVQDVFAMNGYSNPAVYASAFTDNPNVAVTGSTESSGMEYELSANPVPGLLVSINASDTKSVVTGIGSTFVDFFEKTRTIFAGPAGEMTLFGANNYTARKWFNEIAAPGYNLVVASSGTQVPELRPWSVRSVVDYTFQQGSLRGTHFGGAYRWDGSAILGYPVVVDGGNESYDVAHPYKSKSIGAVDLWVGYKRKLNQKLSWTIQLNVRNVFASKELIPVTVQPDGTPAAMRIPEARVVSVTNTFDF